MGSWVPAKARGLALEVFLMFLFYLIIFYLDMYKDWGVLVENLFEESDAETEKSNSESDYETPKQSQSSGFEEKEAQECKDNRYINSLTFYDEITC